MPKINSLLQERTRAVLPIENGNVAVTYIPTALSLNDYLRLSSYSESGERDGLKVSAEMAATLSRTLVDWDLTNDDESPIGTDEESLRELPPIIVASVLAAIFVDMSPKDPTAPASSRSDTASASLTQPSALGAGSQETPAPSRRGGSRKSR